MTRWGHGRPVSGWTAACPKAWKNRIIWIPDLHKILRCEDTGGKVKNHIDIFFDTHEEAEGFGRRQAEIYVLEDR